jgi:hypothetical protein
VEDVDAITECPQVNGKYFSSPMNSKIIEIDHAFVDLYH